MNHQFSHSARAGKAVLGSGRVRTCLVVEGDPAVRTSLEALVRELSVDTIAVADALAALDTLETRAVDLIMTEEFLPGPSGTLLLRTVRYRWPWVTRVLVSGALGPDVLVRAVNECAVHRVLPKRMHPISLRDEIEAALNEAWLAAPDCYSGRLTIPPFAPDDRDSAPERASESRLRRNLYAVKV